MPEKTSGSFGAVLARKVCQEPNRALPEQVPSPSGESQNQHRKTTHFDLLMKNTFHTLDKTVPPNIFSEISKNLDLPGPENSFLEMLDWSRGRPACVQLPVRNPRENRS